MLYYLKRLYSTPFRIVLIKLFNKITVFLNNFIKRRIDFINKNTHINFNVPTIKTSYINIKNLDVSNIDPDAAKYLSKMYIEHKFDLLGSGWVKNSYDSAALGLEGYKYDMNVTAPANVPEGYEPIDWQKDFKSGFRWSEKKWYKDQRIAHKPGSDIKVPWELARLQHLPQLAIFAMADPSLKEQNLKEFKNQILDFIRNNPPRMGVNWTCTMDVGIRVANMLAAYDMFCQMDEGGILDQNFRQTFSNSIYEHALHIVNNLEYSPHLTSNHYLSDIVGLLFACAYLDGGETDAWLAFAVQEVISEMKKEFYEDGGNFESSTSYHRLSGELMAYATALILGLKSEKISSLKNYDAKLWRKKPELLPLEEQEFKILDGKIALPQWFVDRLYKIGRFTADITKPNGEVPQFGDNDSGRFFKFSPNGEFLSNERAARKYLNLSGFEGSDEPFWDENILNHSTLISCMGGIFDDEIFKNDMRFERSFARALAGRTLQVGDKTYKRQVASGVKFGELPHRKSMEFKIPYSQEIKNIFYPDSRIFIFKSDKFYLAVCATPLGQRGHGGHTHNDKLSYELWIDGRDIARDPGTYLYTPIPGRRNEFRSVKAHNVPIIGDLEQNSWGEGAIGLFGMFAECRCEVADFGENFISLAAEYKGVKIIRKFEIKEGGLEVIDMANREFYYSKFEFYSNGYGRLMKNV
ncbi:alginate lyase family protein [uncultured Campylobacter sp.]|uniref:alginate lyase family protein n=1 Tax=uncultured Campylobacter sp. TaxID=218934 RepID=UPI00260A528F|nr:alginate lyase family protein [uncultured Campylobacter sp.]